MRTLRIDRFVIEPELGRITGSDEVHVEPKTMQVLLYLAAHPGKVLSKEQIIDAVWKDTFVTEDVLVRAIGVLRKAFGDSPRNSKTIQTIPKKGYRLIASVSHPKSFGSLAVLPLENLSADPGQEYFVDGMTEALITELARIPALKVISRTSVMRYKNATKSVSEIARELGVEAIVEGSVLRVDGRVRISAQLIEAATDRHWWAECYERDLREVLILQREVAGQIAEEIRVRLDSQQERARPATQRAVNLKAYENYLRGMFYLNRFTPEGFRKGLAYLHQAVEQDPADPLPYAALALGYSLIGHSPAPFPEAYPRAKVAALTALKLDHTLAEAQEALAEVKLYYDWDFTGAQQAFRGTLELNTNLPETHRHYGWYLLLFHDVDEGLEEMKQAKELDPLTPLYTAELGWMYWAAGQYEEAIDEARKSLQLNPDFPVGLFVLGGVHAATGRYEEALELHRKAAEVSADWRWGLGFTCALAGRKDEAREIAAELEREHRPWNTFVLAIIYAALGEKDKAFHWLEEAYSSRHSWIPWIRDIPPFKPLQNDARFQDLLDRINLKS